MKLSAIAARLGARLDGAAAEISGVAGIEEAQPGQLTFVSNPKYASAAKTTQAAALIVAEDFPALAKPTLRTTNPYLAFAKAIELFYTAPAYAPGIHPTAVVHATAKIGKSPHVGPYAAVEAQAELGGGATLLAHVVIYQHAKIGKNFFAHAHAVV